jgi:hypothetical protein
MHYENINGNDKKLQPDNSYDYCKFEYEVSSHVCFGKLFLQNNMAKFNAYNETCDASAVLNLFGRIPMFSAVLRTAAKFLGEGRNAWAHCEFTQWDEANFKKRFDDMKQFVKQLDLLSESKVLTALNEWEDKGT